jgi:hypothetical protein
MYAKIIHQYKDFNGSIRTGTYITSAQSFEYTKTGRKGNQTWGDPPISIDCDRFICGLLGVNLGERSSLSENDYVRAIYITAFNDGEPTTILAEGPVALYLMNDDGKTIDKVIVEPPEWDVVDGVKRLVKDK